MDRKYISSEESRKIMLRIMDVIDKTCRDNGLHYYMSGGTLLGAVRHKGFIPWDDDIDIILYRSEYDKFLEIMKQQAKENYLDIVDYDTPEYYNTFCKICDSRTIAQEEYRKEGDNGYYGIWVDVFPYENFPNGNDKKRKKFMRNCQWLRAMIIAMQTDFSHEKFGKKYVTKLFLNMIARFVGRKKVTLFAHNYATKYKDVDAEYAGCTFTPYKREFFEKKIYTDTTDLPFENKMYMCTSAWDYTLKKMFGNYMELPPVEKRRTHRITAWWK